MLIAQVWTRLKKKAYAYAYVAAVLTSAQASYAYVYAYACVASEDRALQSDLEEYRDRIYVTYSTATREIQIISLLWEVTQTRKHQRLSWNRDDFSMYTDWKTRILRLSWSTYINQKWNIVYSNTKTMNEFET